MMLASVPAEGPPGACRAQGGAGRAWRGSLPSRAAAAAVQDQSWTRPAQRGAGPGRGSQRPGRGRRLPRWPCPCPALGGGRGGLRRRSRFLAMAIMAAHGAQPGPAQAPRPASSDSGSSQAPRPAGPARSSRSSVRGGPALPSTCSRRPARGAISAGAARIKASAAVLASTVALLLADIALSRSDNPTQPST